MRVKKSIGFASATRSFLGYLEGTFKAKHTIKNYEWDLKKFQNFFESRHASPGKLVLLSALTRSDIEAYHHYLKTKGLKTNTRRRKLLTLRRLLRYLTKRNKLGFDISDQILTPHKVERVPKTVSYEDLLQKIKALPETTELGARNRALFWTLAEAGCLVSEVTGACLEDFKQRQEAGGALLGENGALLQIQGKAPRLVPVSNDLYDCIQSVARFLRAKAASSLRSWLFLGHNRFGSLGAPISPRGVELLVRFYAKRFEMPELTPRMIRHSAVLHWYKSGLSKDEIQKRLGLKTPYAFRVYEPLFLSAKASLT